jgi:hypothetical protein
MYVYMRMRGVDIADRYIKLRQATTRDIVLRIRTASVAQKDLRV